MINYTLSDPSTKLDTNFDCRVPICYCNVAETGKLHAKFVNGHFHCLGQSVVLMGQTVRDQMTKLREITGQQQTLR